VSGLLAELVAGLAVGGAYAVLAVGLVLVHRATGVVNFAHGAVGAAGAFAAAAALASGLAPALAAALALGVGAAVNAALGALVALRPGRHTATLVTVAVMLGLQGGLGLAFGTAPRALPLGLDPGALDAVTGAAALGAALTLAGGLRFTRAGLAARAAGLGPEAAGLLGIPVGRVRLAAWGTAGALAAGAGLLWAPRTLLEPNMMDAPLFAAFAAAVIGGLDRPAGALLGGAALGILETLLRAHVSTELGASLTFLVLGVGLWLRAPRRPEAT
jgi:branched-chain amino acid transport system permease protein